MYKVVAFDADRQEWLTLSAFSGYRDAILEAATVRGSRSHMWVAVAHVRGLEVEVVEHNAPMPAQRLAELPAFRAAVTLRLAETD